MICITRILSLTVLKTLNHQNTYISIVGLRGSGKSVEYNQILGHFQRKDKWLVYPLSSAGNPIKTLISKLSKEPFIDNRLHSTTKNSEISSNGKIKIIEASGKVDVSYSSEENMNYYSDEATMAEMIGKVQKKKINILVGIDDISRTQEMVQFLSIWGSLLLEGYKTYISYVRVSTKISKNLLKSKT